MKQRILGGVLSLKQFMKQTLLNCQTRLDGAQHSNEITISRDSCHYIFKLKR